MDLDDEVIQLYVEEAREHLEGIEDVLLEIESGGADADMDLVNQVFRAIHSIKGGAGFFGLERIKELGHVMENVLNMIRNRERVATPETVSVLLNAADMLNRLFEDVGVSNNIDTSAQEQALAAIVSADLPASAPEEKPESNLSDAAAALIAEFDAAADEADTPAPDTAGDSDAASTVTAPPTSEPSSSASGAAPSSKPSAPQNASPAAETSDQSPPTHVTTESKLRVSVKLLDQLMTLAGELVLTRNQMTMSIAKDDSAQIVQASQRLDLITSEIQEAIVSTRMQPVGVVFSKFRRVVRDIARQLNKQILLDIQGEDVELDKTIIEGLSDPLTHLVRNAVDHGIESPEDRKAAGKPEQASLNIRAFHEAGQVIVEVADDGRGINPQKVKAKALENGLLDRRTLEAMGDQELINLIFLPGFSTAQAVSDISGRGVGMDVVNTNLSELGGAVEISSTVGAGTTIRIKLPLTLAIIPSLIVRLGDKRFAIPQVSVQELVRVKAQDVPERIQSIGHSRIMRLRGQLLPVVRLSEILCIDPVYYDRRTGEYRPDRRRLLQDRRDANEDTDTAHDRREGGNRRMSFESAISIIVVAAGSLHYGLVVDQLVDSEEIVVKPLDRHFQTRQLYAGATIQGDGGVAMILDVMALSRFVDLDPSRVEELERVQRRLERGSDLPGADRQSLLLVRSGASEQYAIPLPLITRIEKIESRLIEAGGHKRSMIYRGGSLVLFTIDDVAHVSPFETGDEVYVVVFSVRNRQFGLLMSSIEDTVNIAVEFDRETFRQPGIFGSAIIKDHTTLLVDLHGIVETMEPDWARRSSSEQPSAGKQHRVLIVEDSPFFLGHLKAFLEQEGYSVLTAENGAEGLDILEQRKDDISVVLTDIEMPVMDGFAFTQAIRADERFRHLPVIAVTSLAGDIDKARGFDSGVNEYLIKLDKEQILNCLERYRDRVAEGALP